MSGGVMQPAEWVSIPGAVLLTGRARQTVTRWCTQGLIRRRGVLVNTADLLRVEAEKTAYHQHPTFRRST